VIKNVIGAPSQALQIIFEMQSQRSSQKRALQEKKNFKLENIFKKKILHLDPSYFISA
jgi:hypothetical protein